MNKQKWILSSMLGFYTLIQLIAYIYAVFIGTSFKIYLINYGSIALNFIMGIVLFLFLKKKDSLIVLIALEFTLLADTGLILLEDVETVAVFFFFFAQLFYALRVRQFSKKLPLKWEYYFTPCSFGDSRTISLYPFTGKLYLASRSNSALFYQFYLQFYSDDHQYQREYSFCYWIIFIFIV